MFNLEYAKSKTFNYSLAINTTKMGGGYIYIIYIIYILDRTNQQEKMAKILSWQKDDFLTSYGNIGSPNSIV